VSAAVTFLILYLLITAVFRNYTDQQLVRQAGEFATMLSSRGIETVKRVAWLEAQAAGEKKVFVRLLHRDGQVFSSSNMSHWQDINLNREMIGEAIDGGNPLFETVSIAQRRHRVRILYAAIGPGVVLQLGRSMEDTARFIEAFQKSFAVAMGLLIVAAAGVGWFMARRALSGVEAVTRTARRIAGATLEERVPIRGKGDEIDQLAATFNAMLDRIQGLVAGIKEMNDNIAHDLRSPITRIRGLAEVTLTTGNSVDDYEGLAADTVEECDRLLEMINTMLAISRAEAGVGRLRKEAVDLSVIVVDACALFRPMAEDKGIALECIPAEPRPGAGDLRLLQRMLANILDNAIKYTPAGGRVAVSTETAADGTVRITVADTGIGISERDRPHLFERFFRCDQSRSQSGVGLGLSLSRAIARAHGGEITVTSRAGEGSRFVVALPGASRSDPGPGNITKS
jgi:heavy metal sensor kinase